ncbi:MAG: asparagine synthase (glutamine-hydrolyzing), partial [Candidatus Methylomirabilales bacterium]
MCGIAGKVYRDPARPVEVGVLRAMCGAMAHRGPDDEQLFLDAGVGLGMRRLAVIDLAGGRQPMASEDKRVRAICNGEIYNFRALREELLAGGHRLETRSDVEVLPHLYEREGAGCVARLRGMFAFALWDAGARRLVLARDRLGKKPLVYAPLPDGLVFASELSALLLDPAVDRTLDLEALDAYLRCQAVPAPRTIYRGVRKLPPGHLLVWEDGRLRSEPYWRLDFTRKAAARPEERRARLRELLTESLRLRLVSDVPLGVLLSGGVDSTTL